MDSHAPGQTDDPADGLPIPATGGGGELAEPEFEQRGVFATPGAYVATVKRCQHVYRAALDWVGINHAGGIDHYIEQVGHDLDSGEFFLRSVGRIAQTDPALVIALLVMRMRWIEEFNAAGSMEKFLIDQTLIAFYHQLRLHELIGNVEARAESEYFGDKPLRTCDGHQTRDEQYLVDKYLRRINERLLPALERCQRMLIRSLREMRMTRITRLTIQHVNQVNLGQQQIVHGAPPQSHPPTPAGEAQACIDL
jgi:hypothetical protein